MTKERYHYADVMKGIGILLVLMGHIQRINGLGEWIYAFHMPLFFFISGMFFHDRKGFFKRKAKSLLVPYVSFALISFLYWWLLEARFRPPKEHIDALAQFGNIFFPMNMTLQEPYYFNVVLWFLPCLFVTECMYWSINKVFRNRAVSIGGGILAIIFLYFILGKPWLPLWIPQAIVALPFFYIGNMLFRYKLSILPSESNRRLTSAFISVVILTISIFIVKGGSDMKHMLFTPNYLAFLIIAIGLSFMVLFFSRCINKNRILEWLGINSLTLMLIHDPIKRILIFVYAHLLGVGADFVRENVTHVIIITTLLTLVCVPIILVINRYGRFLIGKSQRIR